jgi:hypothetical protein
LGRLWQQAWLADVARGGPARFADWLGELPETIETSTSSAPWRVDVVVAALVARSGSAVAVEVEPGARCLSATSVRLLEAVLEDLRVREVALDEAVGLLGPVITVLADSAWWPVPAALRGKVRSLATQLAEALAATGAQVREPDVLLAVPDEAGNPEPTTVDLDRAAAACLAVPSGVLASRADEST